MRFLPSRATIPARKRPFSGQAGNSRFEAGTDWRKPRGLNSLAGPAGTAGTNIGWAKNGVPSYTLVPHWATDVLKVPAFPATPADKTCDLDPNGCRGTFFRTVILRKSRRGPLVHEPKRPLRHVHLVERRTTLP